MVKFMVCYFSIYSVISTLLVMNLQIETLVCI
jgi:hypothetical protein